MNHIIKSTQLASGYRETHCSDCALSLVCLPPSVQASELLQLDAIIEHRPPIKRNDALFFQGQAFNRVYAVRSGAVKTTLVLNNGIEQVTGFYLPGDIIGLDSIGHHEYVNSAYALETTTLCAIPYTDLKSLGRLIPSLQDHISGLMSYEIRQGQQALLSISKLTAQERIVMFLLSISTRYQRRRLSGHHFHLPMSRSSIGNYLGLTLETVSRVFAQLQQQQVLTVNNKDVHILDFDYLSQMVEPKSVRAVS
ncbi:fumarate/nitrate reduction transcriptional regulator Fnr [Aquirhabdus parva]|uniref:Fumarate/nitrate reduction transcriptional regulator Fnr n=1 Tax=Aquirhabdus parva TaxID=2283318 RepID=A0A345P9W6_9GAMM|nr:fumarate/nitrate reduction transcriptional regulator Fnr [Aquirhabdus parva]AXI04075.1 fumarate/nitrate reduction transcriptional regulator Fnr [Aquirhabdus parva]